MCFRNPMAFVAVIGFLAVSLIGCGGDGSIAPNPSQELIDMEKSRVFVTANPDEEGWWEIADGYHEADIGVIIRNSHGDILQMKDLEDIWWSVEHPDGSTASVAALWVYYSEESDAILQWELYSTIEELSSYVIVAHKENEVVATFGPVSIRWVKE